MRSVAGGHFDRTNPWQLEEGANHQSYFPANYKVFTEVLSEQVCMSDQMENSGDREPLKRLTEKTERGDWSLPAARLRRRAWQGIFKKFLDSRPEGKPFFYWYGSKEPHRPYDLDSGIKSGKHPSQIDHVPGYWPDNDLVRRDMLDYAIEMESYDSQVGSLIDVLEERGELENTLVIVTSDHGMPFPRSKGHNYDISNRVPLVAHWPRGIVSPNRRATEFVSLIEIAPLCLQLHGIDPSRTGMATMTGKGLSDLLANEPKHDRSFAILGRERNDVWARPGTEAGLGISGSRIREGNWLYLHNFKPDRWPCGDVDLGLKDTDASPTKAFIEEAGSSNPFWQFCFGKRPAEELFNLDRDPDCIHNLAMEGDHRAMANALREKLFAELRRQSDPRILGQGDVFDQYSDRQARRQEGKGVKRIVAMRLPIGIWGIVIVSILGGAIALYRWQSQRVSESMVTVPLHPPVLQRVSAWGRLAPRSDVIPLSAAANQLIACVEELLVAEGDAIVKDQPIAILDSHARRRATVDEARARVAAAEAKLAAVEAGAKPEEIEVQQALIESSQAELEEAKQQFDRGSSLVASRAISEEDQAARRFGGKKRWPCWNNPKGNSKRSRLLAPKTSRSLKRSEIGRIIARRRASRSRTVGDPIADRRTSPAGSRPSRTEDWREWSRRYRRYPTYACYRRSLRRGHWTNPIGAVGRCLRSQSPANASRDRQANQSHCGSQVSLQQ